MSEVWLSRDDAPSAVYELWRFRPELVDRTYYPSELHEADEDQSMVACADDYFERMTGFHLEPGECVKVRIRVEVCE